METTTPDEFIERAVIDINVEFVGSPFMQWTINDTPDAHFLNGEKRIRFHIVELNQDVAIERCNIAWAAIGRRIDKIPVKKAKPPSEAPTGRVDVNRM